MTDPGVLLSAGTLLLVGPRSQDRPPEIGWEYERTTLGWTTCGHNDFRAGVVLDPFAGSGTTLAVAVGNGRDAIGIDLDPRNEDLVRERVGPLFPIDVIRHDFKKEAV